VSAVPSAGKTAGTVIVPLANVTTTCLNISTHNVDFWILSARVPRNATF